jgi:membrane-associated phospholipid phosphatase
MNPLETRSLPGALWTHVPEGLVSVDEALQEYVVANINIHQVPWTQIRWLTENDWGILTSLLLLFACWLLWRARQRGGLKKQLQQVPGLVPKLFVVLLLVAGSNALSSSLLKVNIGRLKPHVIYYNPEVLPALSFPSSHAFNTAFVFALLLATLAGADRRRHRAEFIVGAALIVFTGFTRIVYGQHYPGDVLAGWFFGAGMGVAVSPLLRRFRF